MRKLDTQFRVYYIKERGDNIKGAKRCLEILSAASQVCPNPVLLGYTLYHEQ